MIFMCFWIDETYYQKNRKVGKAVDQSTMYRPTRGISKSSGVSAYIGIEMNLYSSISKKHFYIK